MDRIHIASFLPVPEEALDIIRAVDPRVELHSVSQNLLRYQREPNDPRVDAAAAQAEALEIRGRDAIWLTFGFGDLAIGAPALEWVALASAGADQALRFPPDEHVKMTKMPGLAARVIAEWVLGFMLMDCKGFPHYIEAQHEERWSAGQPGTLEGATVGIVGYGAIGSEIAQLCGAFGAEVWGIRRRASADGRPPEGAPACVQAVWPPDRLREVLERSDYVVLGIPLTEATRQLIGAEQLRQLKPGTALINIARGGVVDWPAMIAALHDGSLRACYTDVTSPEPLPEGHSDWSTPNLFITPHNSGLQPDYFGKAARRFADNLRRYIDGEPLLDPVDRAAGY